MKKNQLKRNSKLQQKQSQSQKVVVNVNQPARRRQTRRRQPSQQQVAQRGPQIIPIPYPIMQQPTFNNNQGFSQPKVAIPNQTFETNYKNLSEQISNLSQRFNTYGDAFTTLMKSSNDKIPDEAVKVKMEEYTPPVQLPKGTSSPILYPEGSIKLNMNDESPTIRVPNQTPVVQGIKDLITSKTTTIMRPKEDGTVEIRKILYPEPRSLFTSPKLQVSDAFTRPKVHVDNKTIFNQPKPEQLLIENGPSTPDGQFEEQLKVKDENLIKDEVSKPYTNYNIVNEIGYRVCPICAERHTTSHIYSHLRDKHLDPLNGESDKKVTYGGITTIYKRLPTETINEIIESIKTYNKKSNERSKNLKKTKQYEI